MFVGLRVVLIDRDVVNVTAAGSNLLGFLFHKLRLLLSAPHRIPEGCPSTAKPVHPSVDRSAARRAGGRG
jgi:hypothetical protein